MNKIFLIARWEYLRRIRSKAFIFTLLLPFIVMTLAFLPEYLNQTGEKPMRQTAVITSDTGLYATIDSLLSDHYGISPGSVTERIDPPDSVKVLVTELLRAGVFDAILIPETDFPDTLSAALYTSDMGPGETAMYREALNSIIQTSRLRHSGLHPELLNYLNEKTELNEFNVSQAGDMESSDPISRFILPFLFLFVLVMGLLTSSQALISSMIEERSSRIVEIILSSTGTKELMAGKIMGMGLLGITQLSFYIAVLFYGSGQLAAMGDLNLSVTPAEIIWYLLYFLAGYFLYSGIYVSMGTLFDNERDAMQISGFFSLFLVVPIYFINFMLENPDALITGILTYIPFMTPFFMIIRIGMGAASTLQTVGMFLYLLAWVYLTIRLSALIFRSAILLYGQKIDLPEIFRSLRNN